MSTATERKQQERTRKREAGLVMVQEWCYRPDVARLRKYAAKLRKQKVGAGDTVIRED